MSSGKIPFAFCIAVLLANSASFAWAVKPHGYGLLLVMYVVVPMNFVFLLAGLVRTAMLQQKHPGAISNVRYLFIIFLPIAAAALQFLLINLFGRHGGC